jgi:hypothetical protein
MVFPHVSTYVYIYLFSVAAKHSFGDTVVQTIYAKTQYYKQHCKNSDWL